jgi:GTP cyclohydrolase-4
LAVSAHADVSADDLVRIVEASMSSEIYELLKRPDELFVVNRAHLNPKFVEDVVRDTLALTLATYPGLPDDAYVFARQVNYESIHRHDVLAERGARLGDLRREIEGGPVGPSIGLEAYLQSLPQPWSRA